MPRVRRSAAATAPAQTSALNPAAPSSEHFRFLDIGLEIVTPPSFEEFQLYFDALLRLSNASMWAIGDAILYGEDRADWGEMYAQAVSLTQRSYSSLANAASVCRKFGLSRRRSGLSFTHHAEVAALNVEQQEALLTEAERQGWSARELREHVRAIRDELNASLRAVDAGDQVEPAARVTTLTTIRLMVTCPDEASATAATIAAQEAGATVERLS